MSKYSWAKALAPGHMGMGPWPWAHGPPPIGWCEFEIIQSKWAYAQTAALEGCFTLAKEEVSGV